MGHAGGESPKLIKLASLVSSTLSRTLLCLCPFEFLQLSQVQRQDQIGPELVCPPCRLSQSGLDDFRRMTWSFAAPCGQLCARPSAVPSRRTL